MEMARCNQTYAIAASEGEVEEQVGRMPRDSETAIGLHAWAGPDRGWGRIGEVNGANVRVDFFESIANPLAESRWFAHRDVKIVALPPQTRVFWEDASRWNAGRVLAGGPASGYTVRKPDVSYDLRIDAQDLRVRWSRSVTDPVMALLAGANEHPNYAQARLPFIRAAVAQRAACSSAPAILSSAVELYPHQLRAVLQVLRDPVQRYLLADEVGLGKTIEAGMIARQILIDKPTAAITFIVPDTLQRQWWDELRNKFFVNDFASNQIRIVAHESPQHWRSTPTPELVVVDEAHHLVAADTPARVGRLLAQMCHESPRLLLLSATPALHHEREMLGLLHLLDPALYRLEDLDGFTARVRARHEIASASHTLDPRFPEFVPLLLRKIREAFPDDRRLASLADAAVRVAQSDLDSLPGNIERVRNYLNETYRLHRRVIRHRRDRVLAATRSGPAFVVRGRQDPIQLELDDPRGDTAEQLLEHWRQRVRDHLFDIAADAETWSAYALAHAVLMERSRDHAGVLRAAIAFRMGDNHEARTAGLDWQEAHLLRTCPVLDADDELWQGLAALPADDESLRRITQLVGELVRRHPRLLIFAGTTVFGRAIAAALHANSSLGPVATHLAGNGPNLNERAVRAWRADQVRALVCDRSAEEGRNFQDAAAVVHLHLPWSVNRLEQRLGRVDRHGDGGPATQYVLVSVTEESIAGAWLALLRDGFGVFRDSLSMLQYAIEEVAPELFLSLLRRGGQGLLEATDTVTTTLRQRRKEIETEDTLEASFATEHDHDKLLNRIYELESRCGALERVVDNLACDAVGSLRLLRTSEPENPRSRRYSPGKRSLLPAHLLDHALPGSWETAGCFDRADARLRGHRVLRLGAPFIDTLWRWAQQDDLGQAAAWWRHTGAVEGDHVYLGFEYIVDADIGFVRQRFPRLSPPALQRQLDDWFVPFIAQLWLDPWATDLASPEHQRLLGQTYNPSHGDCNLNADRLPALLRMFGGARTFCEIVARAADVAPTHLRALCQLEEQAAVAEAAAIRDLGREEERLQSRRLAGADLIGEADPVAAGLPEMLRAACRAPRLRLVAVSCVVLSSRPFTHAAKEFGVNTR